MNFSWFTSNTNRLYYILAGTIGLVVFLTIILILRNLGNLGGINNQQSNIVVWGVFDDSSAFSPVIADFQAQNKGIKVLYQLHSYDTYEKDLVNALAAGTGPDIFMIQNTWLPKHADKISPMPDKLSDTGQSLLTTNQMKNQYVEVVLNDLVAKNKIYALPLYVDTLALYYNRDIFNSGGFTGPPKTWDEFNQYVEKITRLDGQGNISRSAAAIGTSRNINRSTDLLMGLMIQSGVQMNNDTRTGVSFSSSVSGVPVGITALQYYTDFANAKKRVYTWNNSQNYSIDSFSAGQTAMMFNYSHEAAALKAKNPRLNFAVAAMPQISETDIKNYADYWALTVSKASKNPEAAWKFITYATSHDGAIKYLTQTKRPSARRDIIDLQKTDDTLGIFALQALTAKSWLQPDNVAIEQIFADMIDDVNFGRKSIGDALQAAESKANLLMKNIKL